MKVLSLFSGGGLGDRGLELAGMEIIGQVEIDDYCQKIIKLRWPKVLKWKDIRTFLLQGGSLAKTFHLSGLEKDLLVKDQVCGQSFLESFVKYDRNTHSWKMCQDLFKTDFKKSLKTWPRSGMMRNGIVYRLPKSVQTTKEKDFSYWPTPRASQDYKPVRSLCPKERSKSHGITLCAYLGKRWPHLIGKYIKPTLMERLMGLPEGWTDARLQGTAKSFKPSNG